MYNSKVYWLLNFLSVALFSELTRACESEAHLAGYRLILVNTDEDAEKEVLALKALASQRVEGVILASPGDPSPAGLQALRNVGTPLVAVDNELEFTEVDTVVTDNEAAAAEATRHMLSFGHRRITMISGPERASSIRQRRAGFERAVLEAGAQIDEKIIVTGDLRSEAASTLALALMDLPNPPTALFCVNNLSTMGALGAFRERSISIPGQLSVVGFDDIPLRDVLAPRQTVVKQPLIDMGRAAARALLDRIENPDTLVVSESVGAFNDHSKE